uniref:TRP C-terminal domain-containing protein n=1 Tax=Amphimedon queenslandica TaxID=400682 RepID=A0A1X7VPE2_AMPQE
MTLPWVCKTFTYKLNQGISSTGYFTIKTGSYELRNASIVVRVQFLDCPSGLILTDSGTCDCNSIISSVPNLKCNVSWFDTPIRRSGNVWLAYDTACNCSIVNDVCPFDYCNSSTVYLSLDDPHRQCALNRSGVLCGGCQPGLSLMLGSNKCQYCTNKYLSLLIGFIMAGIVLVAFLLICNLTVSAGSINGLLFYANIVKLNEVVLFRNGASIPVLSQFIAWTNLDLGIETCFFNGLDGYWKTWLQFIFPVYIWLLVGAIIIGSYYSGRLSRIFGNNTVPVLATLILMSYSKLLRTITNALMISNIKCKDDKRRVWSVDANIDYLDNKHMILFGVSVTFLMIGLLYGGMIFSIQWLQKCTGRYCKSSRDPIVKLKPLVDSYTGPYKDRYRYWTGLLVFIRVILTALFSYTTQTKPEINNYIIVFVCVLLIRIAAKGIYRNSALNNLEFFHYFNLLCISMLNAVSHQEQWNIESLYFTIASISFSMILFISTVLIHIYVKLENKFGRPKCLKSKFFSSYDEEEYHVHDYRRLIEDEYRDEDSDKEGSPPRVIQRRESMIFDFHIDKREKVVESPLIEL